MHPSPLFFLLFLHVITSLSDDGVSLSSCDQPFDCGPLPNLSFPFSGGPHPCGPPEFRLSCTESSAEMSIAGIRYRVLRVNPVSRTIHLARSDLWNRTCPTEFRNSSVDSEYLRNGLGNIELTMFYRCNTSVLTMRPENQFDCADNNFSISNNSYFLVGPIPVDPILGIVQCNESVSVPIMQDMAELLTRNRSILREALMAGFIVDYTIPSADYCSRCFDFGGRCGYQSNSSEPVCICGNRVCSVPAGNGNNGNGQIPRTVGLSIAGACILGMFIGGLTYYLIQRKKRRTAMAKSVDLTTPPSSKSIIVPSMNFSRSTPTASSYSFSKSDIEKGSTYFGAQIFTYTELEEATENFDSSRELGEGGFGTVYYGKLRDGRVVAVKRLYENNFRRVEQFMNEIEILTRLQHQNLVKLYGCTSRRSRELLLVYEFIPNGTVADHLHGKESNSGKLSWPIRLSIAVETADALAYLHRSDIIHRDVKTNNILLDNECRVKVADFGLSKLFPNDVTHVSTAPQGTPGYVDPEYYQCYQLTTKSDVYSFGVVLVELISSLQAVDTNRHRHDINLANMAINKVQNHLVDELIDPSLGFDKDENARKMVADVAGLAFRCLQQERDLRPSMEEVLATLRNIQKEDYGSQRAEVFDIRADDIGLLRNLPPPLSPDSAGTDKWIINSPTPNSC